MKLSLIPKAWIEVWNFFRDFKKKAILLFVLVVFASFFEAFSIGLLMPILDLIINDRTESFLGKILLSFFGEISPKQSLIIVLIVFLILIILKNIFVVIKVNAHGKFSFGMRGYWMNRLMEKYISAKYNYILDSQQGVLVNNILVESEKSQFCLKYIIQFASSFLLMLFMIVVMFITSWQITLYLAAISGLVMIFSNRFINKYSLTVGDEKIKYARAVSTNVSEGITMSKQIKVLGTEHRSISVFSNHIKGYIKVLTNFFVLSRVPALVSEIINIAIIVSSVIFMLIYTNISIKDLIPMIAVFVVIGSRLTLQIGQLVNSKMEILSNLQSLRNIDALIESDIPTEDLNDGKTLKDLSGNIIFKDVSFAYDENHIFKNLNLTLKSGKINFLIGESGSGKSSIVDMLLRLQQPNSGEILLISENIENYDKASWRQKIGYVSQDVLLFNKSIRENILDGKHDASEQEIYDVLKRANAYDFVNSLPNRLDTIVGDRGVKLSGGQRQRLSLARAIIRDVDFLILDEATSAMDSKLENMIIDEIKLNFKNKTVLFITHRLATAVHADIIFKLDQGEVEELSDL